LDLDLARQAQDGDESAFAEIVRRYSPRVFSTASRFFRQRSLVEEAAQEVFLKAYTQLGSFEGRGSLEGWLTKIATNTCLNMLRGSKRRPELTVSDLSEDEDQWLEQ
jgi:RNA polymerase sigma-70 factor (ECF subfamily)